MSLGYSFSKLIGNSVTIITGMCKRTHSVIFSELLVRRWSSLIESPDNLPAKKKVANKPKYYRRTHRTKENERGWIIATEISEYLSSKESLSHIVNVMPPEFLTRKNNNKEDGLSLYIVDKDVAQQYVDVMKSVWNLEDHHVVLEANPGLGLLSKCLLDAGVKNLQLYESSDCFESGLSELQQSYPNEIKLFFGNIFSIGKYSFLDGMDKGSRVPEILERLPTRHWNEDPVVKIVGALPKLQFIRRLIFDIVQQTGLLMHGRAEFYLAVSHSQFITLTSDRNTHFLYYKGLTVLFQLFFELELLATLPRKSFFPWPVLSKKEKTAKEKKFAEMNLNCIYLVKIVPRKDLYVSVAPVEKLNQLSFFVRHHLVKRTNRVIPQLERWIPGCGSRLILQGMDIFTRFGDLNPQEILALFREFSSWPEYAHSPFLAPVETSSPGMVEYEDHLKNDKPSRCNVADEEEEPEEKETAAISLKSSSDGQALEVVKCSQM